MRTLLLVSTALLLGACTHTRTVASEGAREALNRAATDRTVRVDFLDGRRAAATGLRADDDSVSWVDPATGTLEVAAAADVRAVTVDGRRGRGLLEGLLLGTATGTAAGALVGFTTYEDSSSSSAYGSWCILYCSRGGAATFVGFLGGAAGAVVGSAVGLVRGSPTAYVVAPAWTPVAGPVGPPARE